MKWISILSTNNVVVDKIFVNKNLDDNLTNDDEYVDVNEAYDCLNVFRTEDNVCQWNEMYNKNLFQYK